MYWGPGGGNCAAGTGRRARETAFIPKPELARQQYEHAGPGKMLAADLPRHLVARWRHRREMLCCVAPLRIYPQADHGDAVPGINFASDRQSAPDFGARTGIAQKAEPGLGSYST